MGSSLDDLMLAYTDLSAPAKGQAGMGFKGPPVKDIRREAPSMVFQHSNKARDWRTLDQSLESAFSAAAPVPSTAPAPVFTDLDEWGEFQDFSAPSFPPLHTSHAVGCRLASHKDTESPVHRFKTAVPAPHNIPVMLPRPPLHQSQPSSILDLDDEFGDFAVPTTNSFTSLTSSNISLSATKSFSATFPIDQPLEPMPKHQNTFPIDLPVNISNTFPIDKPVSLKKTFSIDQPIINPLAPPVSTTPLAPMTAPSSDRYSALRMFLDQPDQAADSIASQKPVNSEIFNVASCDPFQSNNVETSSDADFGDFVEVSTVTNVEKSAVNTLSDIFSQPSNPQSNLKDFLSSPETSLNLFPSQPSPVQQVPNKSSNIPLHFSSPPQPRNLPTLLPSPTNQSDDQNLDEWSLPPSQISFENEKPTPNPYKPLPKPTSFPFQCSSPPPDPSVSSILSSSPPIMSSPGSQLNVEEFTLPSEQFGFSDQEIFGIKSVKKESDRPQSIQDVLSFSKKNKTQEKLKPGDESFSQALSKESQPLSLESSRQGSPNSVRVSSKSPETQSVASLEFETCQNDPSKHNGDKNKKVDSSPPVVRYNGFMAEDPQPISSPCREWCLLLAEILSLIESTRDTFDNIISEDLKEEVITSEQGKSFLLNLFEVHKVYTRVAISYKQRLEMEVEEEKVGLEQVGQFCDEIDRDWKRLEEHCDSYGVLCKPDEVGDEGDGVCGVCLGAGGGLVYGGGAYHPGCANYWVNCVTDSLPHLAV